MAAVNFPNSPVDGDTHVANGVTYTYNATKTVWRAAAAGSSSVSTVADMAALIAKTGMTDGDQVFVQANNNLYIYSGTGWYKVATVQNDSPSAITGVDGTYSLAIDGTPTVITGVSTDPEGFPLTWSYSTSGLGSIATISQTDNVFTITPSTDEANFGTFTLTINATDGVSGAVNANTSITLEFFIANSNYTTLLATAVDTSDNNNITDSSVNNHTITANGDAHAGTFSPYRHGGYSTYFDGSDYLQLSATATNLLPETSNTTIEAWVNTTVTGHVAIFSNFDPSSPYNGMEVGLYNGYQVFYSNSAGWINNPPNTGVSTINDGNWHHLAWVITNSGTTVTAYVDGVQNYTSSITASTTGGSNIRIGASSNTTVNRHFTGYIADFRFVKGAAVYSAAFTPPTAHLTAITNTQLLACHLPYIADGSSSALSITVNGNTSTKPFGPYDNLEYSASDHGGSVSMPNDNDYLSVPHSSTLKPSGTDPFCVSFWYYPTTSPGTTRQLVGDANYVSYPTNCPGWDILYQSGSQLDVRWGYPNYADMASGKTNSTVQVNAWNHIAFCRSGGSLSYYLNGKRCNTTTSNINISASGLANFYVGYAGESTGTAMNSAMGTIADFKYEVGTSQFDATASTITVPTAPQSTTNSVLHVKGTDASVIDKAQTGNMKVFGTATGSSAEAKFANTKSMYFPGSNPNHIRHYSQIYLPGELTIECWVNTSTFNSGYVWCLENYQLEMRINSNGTGVDIYDSGYINFSRAAGAMSTGTWYHIAVCRDSSNVFRAWIDGVRSTQSGTKTTTYDKDHIIIGGEYSSATGINWPYHGYVQDLRISNYARYSAEDETTNIPTAPFKG